MQRRTFLKGTIATSTLAIVVSAGMLSPRTVLAAWPKSAFEAKTVEDALNSLLGNAQTTPSADIKIKAPDIAENGAVVPVTITTSITGIESISIVAMKNGNPLAANFIMTNNTKGFISTRIKMGKTSDVVAIVKAGGKSHAARKNIKVTIGGCGG
ncbi:Sulfur oxidation protein SoxY [hydrothermal vent metagenome]|uniref:Sulfur oxidation protein SoxY n=1 Tax=hydrothermal vent metagenome TaxID=652676 RepID=A0A3B0ZWQ6_9ZZZZ